MTGPQGPQPSPEQLQQRLQQAIRAMNTGDARRAADLAIPLLPFGSQHPDLLNLLGTALLRLGDFENAKELLRRAIETGHAEPAVRVRLARAQHRAGEHDEAIRNFRSFLQERPDNEEARRSLVSMLVDLRRFDEAEEVFRPMLNADGKPTNHKGAVALARLSESNGRERDAIEALERFLPGPGLTPLERATMLLHIGRLKERTGDAPGAFEAFKQMNEMDRDPSYDPAAHSARVDRLIEAWRGNAPMAMTDPGQGEGLVFIVGMPRSGTTLIEQMLAAHPRVLARGERVEKIGRAHV